MNGESKSKHLAFAICEYLQSSISDRTVKADAAESLEIAIQCIGESFGVDPSDPQQAAMYSMKPASLNNIFDVYLKTRGAAKKAELKPIPDSTQAAATASGPTLKDKDLAESLKAQGNQRMSAKQYDEAIELYGQAIKMDSRNAVYFANRAAAYIQLGKHDEAIEDSLQAIEVDPNYSKAYSRAGHAYFSIGKYQESKAAYEKGLALDPTNATMKSSLETAQQKLAEIKPAQDSPVESTRGAPGPGGAPGAEGFDFASLMNNPSLSGLMNNPNMRNMASQMMQNPMMAQMAQNLMSNPDSLNGLLNNPNLASMLGGAGGGGAGGSGAGGGTAPTPKIKK